MTSSSSSSSSPTSTELVATSPSSSSLTQAEAGRLYVVFRVGDADYALAAHDVLQMESYAGATAIPGARAFVVGIIQLRGRVVPVIDLRARFGLPPLSEPSLESRVVVAELAASSSSSHRAVALLVDRAREVVRIRPSELTPPPRLVDDGGFVQAVVQQENRTILVLDFARVIGDDFEAVETEKGAVSDVL